MKKIAKGNALLIYEYPEANLSPKEQIEFRKILDSLDITIIVLTGSPYFLADNLFYCNYIRHDKQLVNQEFVKMLEWEAPLNFSNFEIIKSLYNFLLRYQEKVEICPVISNYELTDIMLFECVDLYVAIKFLIQAKYPFKLNLNKDLIPEPMKDYILMVTNKYNLGSETK